MNPRIAMKATLIFILNNMAIDRETAERLAEQMHDDDVFLERLESFVTEHLEDFGENYGL